MQCELPDDALEVYLNPPSPYPALTWYFLVWDPRADAFYIEERTSYSLVDGDSEKSSRWVPLDRARENVPQDILDRATAIVADYQRDPQTLRAQAQPWCRWRKD